MIRCGASFHILFCQLYILFDELSVWIFCPFQLGCCSLHFRDLFDLKFSLAPLQGADWWSELSKKIVNCINGLVVASDKVHWRMQLRFEVFLDLGSAYSYWGCAQAAVKTLYPLTQLAARTSLHCALCSVGTTVEWGYLGRLTEWPQTWK